MNMNVLTPSFENARARGGFFGRNGGISAGEFASLNCSYRAGETRETTAENRGRIADALGFARSNLATVSQVHSADVVIVEKPFPAGQVPDADALVTATPGLLIGILTADCGPILFADKNKNIVGAAHAGWKGALNGVLEATIEAMEKLGSKRDDIEAAIGPCIGPASYEVDDGFKAAFLAKTPHAGAFFTDGKPGHHMFDLPAYIAQRLKDAGIKTIIMMAQDTCALPNDYFSFRRQTLQKETDSGRQISAIGIVP